MTDQFFKLAAGAPTAGEEVSDPKSKTPDAVPAQTNFMSVAIEVQTNEIHFRAGLFDLMDGETVGDERLLDSRQGIISTGSRRTKLST